jgi:hypothetical protein
MPVIFYELRSVLAAAAADQLRRRADAFDNTRLQYTLRKTLTPNTDFCKEEYTVAFHTCVDYCALISHYIVTLG